VLEHLANRLAAMDSEVLADAIEQTRAARDQVKIGVNDLLASVREHAPEAQAASEGLWSRVSRIHKGMAVGLGALVSERPTQARRPCPVPPTAVTSLLRLGIRSRSHSRPGARRCLDTLNLEAKDPETGETRTQVTVETTLQGAEMLQKRISQLVQQASWQSRK